MEEELDEIEDGKIDWRAAMSEFYDRFDRDLKQAEQSMTDVKRLEKPTELTCEKCGRPLVIKWGQHGSFLACTGYPDFSPRAVEDDFKSLQEDIARRKKSAEENWNKDAEKLQARLTRELGLVDAAAAEGKLSERQMRDRRGKVLARQEERMKAAVKKVEERRLKDRDAVQARLDKIISRYSNLTAMYHVALNTTPEGLQLEWNPTENFCRYTRELTVDLPDVDKVGLTDQGEEEYCENCGRPMVLKKGRFGTFYACTGYPDCKTTKQIGGSQQQKKADVPLDEKCPNCGNNLVLKSGRFGEFTACSNYPACKYVKQKTIGVKCPECSEGEVVERRSRKGKTFYGCNRWPDCNFVAWGKPIPEKCPECGSPYMVEKWLKAGTVWQCPNAECKHKVPAPQPVPA
jgi:DNA topoisomerase-1